MDLVGDRESAAGRGVDEDKLDDCGLEVVCETSGEVVELAGEDIAFTQVEYESVKK